MEEERRNNPLGLIITVIGYLGLLLFFLVNFLNLDRGPLGSFLGSNLLIPIALIILGRTITRRTRRRSISDLEEVSARQPEPAPAPRPRPRPEPRPSIRPPAPEAEPIPLRELSAALGLDDEGSTELPRELKPSEEFRPKSSEEMIAEAKRRLKS